MGNKFGSVTFKGNEYTLTQQPSTTNYGTSGQVVYEGAAVDANGQPFRVRWETTPEWDKAVEDYRQNEDDMRALGMLEDESLACDWDRPVKVWED